MNDLFVSMKDKMGIIPYTGEIISSFEYRVLLSALGLWCLQLASGRDGISKKSQTIRLTNLIQKYSSVFPEGVRMLLSDSVNLPVFIRNLYEETGYLVTDSIGNNHLSSQFRTVCIGKKSLSICLPEKYSLCGLGIQTNEFHNCCSWRDFLVRDMLTPNEFIKKSFDLVNFSERDIRINDFQLFNPRINKAISQSWAKDLDPSIIYTISRKDITGPYFLVVRLNDSCLFCQEEMNSDPNELTSYEYRRTYYALKKYYGNEVRAWVKKIDKNYFRIQVESQLPNREYFFLLLIGWPWDGINNKREFLIERNSLNTVCEMFSNLGIRIIGG